MTDEQNTSGDSRHFDRTRQRARDAGHHGYRAVIVGFEDARTFIRSQSTPVQLVITVLLWAGGNFMYNLVKGYMPLIYAQLSSFTVNILNSLIPNLGPVELITAILGVISGQQLVQSWKLNRMESKMDRIEMSNSSPPSRDGEATDEDDVTSSSEEDDTQIRTDGGDDETETSGGGAIGGAIAGGALGSAYGPGGVLAGAFLGAVIGDSIEANSQDSGQPRDNKGQFK